MRILVVGAGAIGGYFGGRLLAAGREVTFLVRPPRATALARTGLVIKSPTGDAEIPNPPIVTADQLDTSYDLILLSCKAYDLAGAIESLAPAVGERTAIVPLLNGMRHLDDLRARFGDRAVLGGQCVISSTLDPEGRIVHLNELHSLTFGELAGGRSPRVEAIERELAGAGFDAAASEQIQLDMWEKWVFLSSLAAATCLMRSAIGDLVAAGGADLSEGILEEATAIAGAQGYAPRPAFRERAHGQLTQPGSTFAASMLRDLELGRRTEADHIIGDLLRRGEVTDQRSLLRIAYVHVRAASARREREAASA
ncbi:MAG: 2-dehydropantoate 2-reductase [Candidatus Dormiibacterota bacterium]